MRIRNTDQNVITLLLQCIPEILQRWALTCQQEIFAYYQHYSEDPDPDFHLFKSEAVFWIGIMLTPMPLHPAFHLIPGYRSRSGFYPNIDTCLNFYTFNHILATLRSTGMVLFYLSRHDN